jgi:hypothetical protein
VVAGLAESAMVAAPDTDKDHRVRGRADGGMRALNKKPRPQGRGFSIRR